MKYLFTCLLLALATTSLVAQKQTFDAATYTPPPGWKKASHTTSAVSYAITNNEKGTYCQIGIYASTTSKGSLQADFKSEWEELIVKLYKPTEAATLVPTTSDNGWDIQGGSAPFEFSGGRSVAMLVTASGHGRCMSIVILTNTVDHQAEIQEFLESVTLNKPETTATPVLEHNVDGSIVGTWAKGASPNQKYDDYKRPYSANNSGYAKDQYTFNADGTYTYVSKTFRMIEDKILLVRENGSYEISGKNLTVIPKESAIEAWSKKDGTDKWGALLSTQSRPLEKVTYTFTKHYFSGIQQWNLVLQADKETRREGPFSTNTTFTNAWYYMPISSTNSAIDLPATDITQKITDVAQPPATTDFRFSTSNFDDGWTSTIREDWVEVAKGNLKVLIHYPSKKTDEYNPVLLDKLKNSWNFLVAPRYSSASDFEFKPYSDWQSLEYAEANAVERETGKRVFVVLFKFNYFNGGGTYMEFITPDKATFEREFGAYHQSTSGWEKMEKMSGYNKFAIAESDLKGTWSNNFSGTLQYVNANTGLDAGMSSHASNEKFVFGPGNTYQWSLGVASGMVGNLKFQSVKSSGNFSVPDNWRVTFSDIEGKPRTYNAHFACVKGARVLWLGETGFGRVE